MASMMPRRSSWVISKLARGSRASASRRSISANHSLRKPRISLPRGRVSRRASASARAATKSSSSRAPSGPGLVNVSSTWSRITIRGLLSRFSWLRQVSARVDGGAGSGGLECREQRPQQALLRVAAPVADLDAVALQPGHEAGIQQRRLAHPRAAVQEQDRRPARLLDLLEQLADRVVPAEEDLGIAGREPGEVAERAL